MSKEVKNSILPKQRFVEFVNSGEWVTESFTDIYRLISTNSYSRDQLNYDNGSVKNIHYGDIHTKFSTLFDITKENVPFINPSIELDNLNPDFFCIESDLVFADASEDLKDVGKHIEIVNSNGEKVLSGMHTILARQRKPKLIIGFGGYLFLSTRIRIQIQKEAQGAKVFGISGNRLSNIIICYPESKKEQRKIADCLSSLDELITAENQKLEELKAHKKGLLQNLFPAKGETLPNFRFDKFEETGDWEETTLTLVADYENGKAHEQDIEDGGNFIVVNSKFISTDGEVKKYTNAAFCPAHKGDILMVLSDVPNGKAIAKCFLVEEDDLYTVNQRICRITPRNLNSKILFYLLNRNPYFLTFDDGVKQTNLKQEDVLKCPLIIPSDPEEQEKIANTLSSIDELIIAQRQRLEALILHKKGLLQGLFPDIN